MPQIKTNIVELRSLDLSSCFPHDVSLENLLTNAYEIQFFYHIPIVMLIIYLKNTKDYIFLVYKFLKLTNI